MSKLIDKVRENSVVRIDDEWGAYVPFVIDGKEYGYLQNSFAEMLGIHHSDVFQLRRGTVKTKRLELAPDIEQLGVEGRTTAVLEVCKLLRNKGKIRGWRNELLPVLESFSSKPAFLIERAAYPWFGVKGYGVHVNGFVRVNPSSAMPTHLWVARRAKNKSTWPGMLDHIVAGAQPAGISPMDNVAKECGEEANIPEEMARKARPVGAVAYQGSDEQGCLKRDTLFCFDIELPLDFVPTPGCVHESD